MVLLTMLTRILMSVEQWNSKPFHFCLYFDTFSTINAEGLLAYDLKIGGPTIKRVLNSSKHFMAVVQPIFTKKLPFLFLCIPIQHSLMMNA
jgi:hypothetical protein